MNYEQSAQRPPPPAACVTPASGGSALESAGPRQAPLRFSKGRLGVALAIALISDVVGAFAALAPPLVWLVDLVTAILLFTVLGRQWLLLPGLVLEAIPGIGVAPLWLLVVGAIALWGTARPKRWLRSGSPPGT